jgi:predicted RNA-binding protein with PIN domain
MFIIDGHNLIGSFHDLSLSDKNVKDKLLNRLSEYQKIIERNIIVVFDGIGYGGYNKTNFQNIEIRYPEKLKSADDEIIKLISEYNNQHGISIISSDNEIKYHAKKAHLSIQNSHDFAHEVEDVIFRSGEETENYLSPSSVDEWLEIFKNNQR